MNKVVWNKIWKYSPPTKFAKKYRSTIVKAKNIHLYTYANAVNISSNDKINKINKITIKNYTGKVHTVKAKYYILACGAIQNSRLLLASNKKAIKGLGNQNDLVGRFFMEHIEFPSGQLWFSEDQNMELYVKNEITNTKAELGIRETIQKKNKILNGTVSFAPLANSLLVKSKNQQLDHSISEVNKNNQDISFLNRIKNKLLKIKVNRIDNIEKGFQLYIRMEQAPNPNSRIYLSNEKDSLGVPYANLHWEFTELERKSMKKIIEIIGCQIGISDLGRVKLTEYLWDENDNSTNKLTGGMHHMGTTKMSNNPKTGVVDANCKIHGIANLFVAGSACFPTAGVSNPTLAIVALSLRLSDHIKNKYIKEII